MRFVRKSEAGRLRSGSVSRSGNITPVESARIAVVGGGIIGLSIAWRLAKLGFTVDIFEKGRPGGESSWAGAGMLSLGGEIDQRSPEATLAIESRHLYSDFVRELQRASGQGIDYQECGSLDVAYTADEKEALNARAARQTELGIFSKPLTAAQVSTFWPRVRNNGLAAARFYPGDAIVNPREMTEALAAACRKLNVAIHENCGVARIQVFDNEITLESLRGPERFQAAVLAAGAWSSQIPVAGVPSPPAAEPVKGHLIGYQQPEQTCSTIVRHGETYLLQRANGLLIAGASVEHVGFDRQVRPEIVEKIAQRAGFVFPHLRETSPSETWFGFRPGSERLWLGMWHSPHLYLAYGHFRNGILLAPVSAERIGAEVSANLQTR